MKDRIFEKTPYGKAALDKLAPIPDNFFLYEAGWLGNNPAEFSIMKVKGAIFREAKSGKNKGSLSIIVKGSIRTAYVTLQEMEKYREY